MQKLMPGESKDFAYGPTPDRVVLQGRIDRHHDGVAIIVTHHPTLNRSFPEDDLAAGRAYLEFLRDEAKAGRPVWAIEAGATALVNAGHAVSAADQELIDSINATMDGVQAEIRAEREREAAIAADIMATADYAGWKQQLRAEVKAAHAAQQPRPEGRTVFPTRTRVHCKPASPAELDRMRKHVDGVVTCAPGQSWTLLRGILRRGYADPASVVYWPGTRKISSVRLNDRGHAAIRSAVPAA